MGDAAGAITAGADGDFGDSTVGIEAGLQTSTFGTERTVSHAFRGALLAPAELDRQVAAAVAVDRAGGSTGRE